MRKLIVTGVAALAIAAAGTIATAPDADAATRGYTIAKPAKKATKAERKITKPRAGTALKREGDRLNSTRYLPGDACTVFAYRGTAKKSRTNGRTVWSIRSKVNRHRFHTYRYVRTQGTHRDSRGRVTCQLAPKKRTTSAAEQCRKNLDAFPYGRKIGLAYAYATTSLSCDKRGRLIADDEYLPEDAYGWNCFVDGDSTCGDLPKVDGSCRIDTRDGYTMCPDGRVYNRAGDGTKRYPLTRTLPA